jgi:hypothetical protein
MSYVQPDFRDGNHNRGLPTPIGTNGPIDINILQALAERPVRRAGPKGAKFAATDATNAFETLATSKRIEPTGDIVGSRVRRSQHAGGRKPSVLDEIMIENEERKRASMAGGTNTPGAAVDQTKVAVEAAASISATLTGALLELPGRPDSADEVQTEDVTGGESETTPGDESWLSVGIVVKVVSSALRGGPYHKKKGVVTEVGDQYTAVVKLFDSSAVLQLDQDDLETVLPKRGGTVMCVRGRYRGKRGTVLDINEESYCLSIRLEETLEVVNRMEYEHVCKIFAG